jgi:hypothetical protein
MVLLGVGSVVLLRKAKQGSAGARPAAAVCALLTLVLAVGRMVVGGEGNQGEDAVESYRLYQEVCGTYLGQELALRHTGARVVILVPPRLGGMPEASLVQESLVNSLQAALQAGGASAEVREVAIPEDTLAQSRPAGEGTEDPEAQSDLSEFGMMEYGMSFDTERLSGVLSELQGEADLVVCTMDMAAGVAPGSLPEVGSAPLLVLLPLWIEDLASVLETTVLDAVVLHQDDPDLWQADTSVPDDLAEAFHQRFVLVTKENVASLKGTHPQI